MPAFDPLPPFALLDHTKEMEAGRRTTIRYVSLTVAALSLPALCFSGFVFFALWAASLNGLGLMKGTAALLLAIALPALCIFGPVQAQSGRRDWRPWAWLLSPLVPSVGLILMLRL